MSVLISNVVLACDVRGDLVSTHRSLSAIRHPDRRKSNLSKRSRHRPTSTMSEQEVTAAAKGVEEVRLDENGQPLSKNALKKLLKAEAAAKKKADKAQAKVRYYHL